METIDNRNHTLAVDFYESIEREKEKLSEMIREIEDNGFLSYEEKIFLWAYTRWETNFCLENRVSLL